ncbi:hypothetical protein [Chryseobacterium profundimaris]|uniref:Right handed beta helix domain-containing protein n=1 Tax=Chryseobacterium profundimaris TaxID=1387275 RepID=A0ABY1P3S1_9FLAO|nr:hypothetical protein [Chryseobacterium profundimaris]SMP24556.1 hypothetical protein SAMN06264346_10842 [Chryseobacterium profundimaris]
MRKNYLKLFIAAAVISFSSVIHSCSEEEDTTTIAVVGIAQDPANFKGEVSDGQVVTLDATKVYVLNGAVRIKSGGKLVIPAGTRIVATAGIESYIMVEQGGQIYANGTPASPVTFNSSAATAGTWGGVMICGKAPINTGSTATTETGNASYGGTVATDNSGSLTYVRIENAGITFAADKNFNGLSLYGVGSDTKVENIALVNGAEDGIQLYGGTVNLSNIVSINNGDDAFVWTDGWIGTATNIYTKRRTNGAGNTGIKGINNALNADASPRSNPTIKNVTLLGGTSGESQAIRLYSGTYANFENVVLSDWTDGFSLENNSTVAYINGQSKITDVFFDTNVTNKITATATDGSAVTVLPSTYSEKPEAAGAGNKLASPAWAIGWSTLQ